MPGPHHINAVRLQTRFVHDLLFRAHFRDIPHDGLGNGSNQGLGQIERPLWTIEPPIGLGGEMHRRGKLVLGRAKEPGAGVQRVTRKFIKNVPCIGETTHVASCSR